MMPGKRETVTSHRNAIFLLTGASRLIQRDFERRSKPHGLSRAQWQVLAKLRHCEGERQIELAARLDMAPIVLARIIDRLEGAGYVERRLDPDDRRARLLYLTPLAEPLIEQMHQLAEATGTAALSGFSVTEIEHLTALLGRLCGNLSDTFETESPAAARRGRETRA